MQGCVLHSGRMCTAQCMLVCCVLRAYLLPLVDRLPHGLARVRLGLGQGQQGALARLPSADHKDWAWA